MFVRLLRSVLLLLLLLLHPSAGQRSSADPTPPPSLLSSLSSSPESLVSFLLLGLTVLLSASVYLGLLRFVCRGCCQPVAVGVEAEALAVIV